MSRRATLTVMLGVAVLVAPAPAAARSVRVPLISAHTLFSFDFATAVTRVHDAIAVGPTGSRVSFECMGPASRCRFRPVQATLGRSGVFRFRRPLPARPGATIVLTTVDPSGARRITSIRTRRAGPPRVSSRCFLSDQPDEVSCFVTCDTEATVPPGDRCAGAGKQLVKPRQDGAAEWRGDESRFKRLILTRVPRDAFVVVECRDAGRKRACPFERRVTLVRRGRLNVGRHLRRRWLPTGTVVELTLFKGALRGQVVRYTMRRQRVPQVQNLCLDPGETVARRCR